MSAKLTEAALSDLATRALVGLGLQERDAADAARILVLGELMGLSTHGVGRIESYGERIDLGGIKARPDIRVSGSFDDVDAGDTHWVTIDWGDGSPIITIDLAAGVFEFLATHDYDDDPGGTLNAYDVQVTVFDGAASDTENVGINVTNVAPVATLDAPISVEEGSSFSVALINPSDPSSADTTAGFKYSYDFDNDGTFEITASSDASVTVPASYLNDGPGSQTVKVRIEDKDGDFTDYTTTIKAIKGVGWALKTMGKFYPDLVVEWLEVQVVGLQRKPRALMLRKALVYLSDEQRTRDYWIGKAWLAARSFSPTVPRRF